MTHFSPAMRSLILTLPILLLLIAKPANADSAIELLSGFDESRIESAYPPSNEEALTELAKLAYRLKNISHDSLSDRVSTAADDAVALGDAIAISGTIESIVRIRLPSRLAELLEFRALQSVTLRVEQSTSAEQRAGANQPKGANQLKDTEQSGDPAARRVQVFSQDAIPGATVGDRIEAMGVVVGLASGERPSATALVSLPLKWFPAKPQSPGWQLLSEAGMDVSELAGVAGRNRKPLAAADNEAFYQMLSVAQSIGGSPRAAQVEPVWIKPADLLQQPQEFSGEWVRMRLQTVRITSIAVTDPQRQQQIDSDHYYQIDAQGDLGNVVILIQKPEAEGTQEPIRFEGTYPVSLVVKELPPFLANAVRDQEGGDAASAMISRPIQIEGFFFRLWSYSSDFMERQGGGDQFGPLLMVARMTDRTAVGQPGAGVEVIGYIAAIAIICGILATLLWSRFNARRDEAARARQKERQAETFQSPE